MNRKIKIGVLLNSESIDAINYTMLQHIQNSDYAEISVFIVNTGVCEPIYTRSSYSFPQKLWKTKYLLVLRFFIERILSMYINAREKKYSSVQESSKNIADLGVSIPVIYIAPKQTKNFDYFSEQNIQLIQSYNVDVIFRNGFRILQGDILKLAPCGIWSFHHGDNAVNRGGPAGFWEYYKRWNKTGCILQILTQDLDNGLIIEKSFSRTNILSHRKNVQALYHKTSLMFLRNIQRLHTMGCENFMQYVYARNKDVTMYGNKLFVKPGINELFTIVYRDLRHRIISILGLQREKSKWILLYRFQNGISSSFWKFKKLIPPNHSFWADPFIVFKDNLHYVFFEEFDYSKQKGHIAMLTLQKTGEYSQPKKILEKPYHLSYPYIFEHEGIYYMIPESSHNKTIDLYTCTAFPDTWEFTKTLIPNIDAHDASILYKDNTWWIFVNVVAQEGISPHDELYIFYAESLFADTWQSHPQNPVISDVEFARPAGVFFEHNGMLYRPSQNNTNRYGYGLNFNKIITLTTQEYKEEPVQQILPNWDTQIKAIHSFAYKQGLCVVDCIREI